MEEGCPSPGALGPLGFLHSSEVPPGETDGRREKCSPVTVLLSHPLHHFPAEGS